MWIIRDPKTQEQVGTISQVLLDDGPFRKFEIIRAEAFGQSKDFDAPPFRKTEAFLAAQAWIEVRVCPSECPID